MVFGVEGRLVPILSLGVAAGETFSDGIGFGKVLACLTSESDSCFGPKLELMFGSSLKISAACVASKGRVSISLT